MSIWENLFRNHERGKAEKPVDTRMDLELRRGILENDLVGQRVRKESGDEEAEADIFRTLKEISAIDKELRR